MGRLSDARANAALDAQIPSPVWVDLSTTLPTNTGGNVSKPPTTAAYATASGPMGAASGRSRSNSAAITFPTPSATWGSPSHFALYTNTTTTTLWAASTAYALDHYVVPNTANGHIYKVTTAGTSGATEPVWPTAAGSTVTDGTVTWTEAGAPAVFVGWGALGSAQTINTGATVSYATDALVVTLPA